MLITHQEFENISCAINIIYDAMYEIYNYSDCGYIGDTYSDFKRITCDEMFHNQYYILLSLMVLTFLTIPIVILSLCMDFMYEPRVDFIAIETKNKKAKLKSKSHTTSDSLDKVTYTKVQHDTDHEDVFIGVDGSIGDTKDDDESTHESIVLEGKENGVINEQNDGANTDSDNKVIDDMKVNAETLGQAEKSEYSSHSEKEKFIRVSNVNVNLYRYDSQSGSGKHQPKHNK
eukprot:231318_1